MPGDEKAVDADHSSPSDSPPAIGFASSSPPSQDRSLWTASDARGPLGTAAEGSVEGEHEPFAAASADTPIPDDAPAPLAGEPVAEHPIPAAADGATPREAPPKRSLLPIAAGVVIGALIGAGSAAVVYTFFAPIPAPDPQVAALSSRVDTLEHRPDPQSAVVSLQSSVSALSGKVADLQAHPAANAAPPPASPPPKAVDLTPLQQQIAALQAAVDALKAQSADTKGLEAKIATLGGDVAAAKTETAATQSSLAGVTDAQKLLATKAMVPALAVAADSLVQQVDQGQPYAAQVDALVALGADPAKIAILRQGADAGVPSAKILAAKFEPLTGPIIATAHKASPNAGFVDRLKSGMFSMVSVRSADDTSGTDLPSRVARIQDDLAHDDIAGALAAWDALPADAQTKGEAWSALAKTSAEAMNAARALQHDAIVALGARKS